MDVEDGVCFIGPVYIDWDSLERETDVWGGKLLVLIVFLFLVKASFNCTYFVQ